MVFGAGVIFVFFRWSKYRVVRNPPTTNPNQQLSSLWIKAIFMPCQWLQHSGWGEGKSEGFVGHAMICTNMPRCWRILDFVEQGKLILLLLVIIIIIDVIVVLKDCLSLNLPLGLTNWWLSGGSKNLVLSANLPSSTNLLMQPKWQMPVAMRFECCR